MTVYDAIKERRTARLFNGKPVSHEILLKLIDGARLSPAAANLQPLKYGIVTDEELRRKIYPHVRYAGYIKDWNPGFKESPKAFIAVFCDPSIRPTDKSECDSGIAMMAISLLAHEEGLGSCIIGSLDRKEVKEILGVSDDLDLMYLVALGYHDTACSSYDSDETIKYHMEAPGNFVVPKRTLESIVICKK